MTNLHLLLSHPKKTFTKCKENNLSLLLALLSHLYLTKIYLCLYNIISHTVSVCFLINQIMSTVHDKSQTQQLLKSIFFSHTIHNNYRACLHDHKNCIPIYSRPSSWVLSCNFEQSYFIIIFDYSIIITHLFNSQCQTCSLKIIFSVSKKTLTPYLLTHFTKNNQPHLVSNSMIYDNFRHQSFINNYLTMSHIKMNIFLIYPYGWGIFAPMVFVYLVFLCFDTDALMVKYFIIYTYFKRCECFVFVALHYGVSTTNHVNVEKNDYLSLHYNNRGYFIIIIVLGPQQVSRLIMNCLFNVRWNVNRVTDSTRSRSRMCIAPTNLLVYFRHYVLTLRAYLLRARRQT